MVSPREPARTGNLPDLTSLRCFLFAARRLNFRAAAEDAGIAPTAFGQRIRQLEADVGAALFTRTTRSVELTPAGIALVARAERCLAEARACLNASQDGESVVDYRLTVGTRHELGLSWLYPTVAEMRRTHPSIRLNLEFGNGTDLVRHVKSGRIDCAVTSTRIADTQLTALGLHREEYCFCASNKLIKQRPFFESAHAAAHTLIDISDDLPLFRYWRDAPRGKGSPDGDLRFSDVVAYGTIEAVRAAVREGAGVAVLPSYFVAEDMRRGRVIALFPKVRPLSDGFRLIHRTSDARTSLFAELASIFRNRPLR